MRTPEEMAAAIKDMQDDILLFITNGHMPGTVASLTDVNDHCDGNELAGFCDENRRADWETEDLAIVQQHVDVWLQRGGHLSDTQRLIRAAQAVPLAWLASCTKKDKALVLSAFKTAQNLLPDAVDFQNNSYPMVAGWNAVRYMSHGPDPRGGSFIRQAWLQAGHLHDAALRAVVEEGNGWS
jgi:hypothetical protein